MQIEIKDKNLLKLFKEANIDQNNVEYFEGLIKSGISFYNFIQDFKKNKEKSIENIEKIIKDYNL